MLTQGTKLSSAFDLTSIPSSSNGTTTKSKDSKAFSNMLSDATAVPTDKGSSQKTNAKKEFDYSSSKDVENRTYPKNEISKNKDTVKNSEVSTVDDSMSTMNEDVANVMDNVKEAIQDSLGISKEDLESAMEVLGLTLIDLLNPATLQQLLLTNTGNEDILSFVTNEDLANTFSDLLTEIQGIVTESGIPTDVMEQVLKSEEFQSFLNQNLLSDEQELSQDKNTINVSQNSSLDELDVHKDSEPNSEITFSVERSDDKKNRNESSSDNTNDTFKKSNTTQVENFLDHIATNVTTTETTFSGELSTVTTIREIANQIIEEIKVVIKPSQTSMELQLNPENLGKVQLTLTSKEGIMTAQFTTQTQMAKEAIESQLQVLKQNLENQGVKVEAIEVNVSNFSFTGNNEAGKGQESGTHKGKKVFRMDVAEDVEASVEVPPTQTSLLDETISNVDYSA